MSVVTNPSVSDEEIYALKSILKKLDQISESSGESSIQFQMNGVGYVFQKQDGGYVLSALV